MKTLLCLVHAAPVSVRIYVSCLGESEGLVLLVFSIPSGSYILSESSSVGFSDLRARDLINISNLDSFHVMSDCGSLYLFPSAVRGSLSDDDWRRH